MNHYHYSENHKGTPIEYKNIRKYRQSENGIQLANIQDFDESDAQRFQKKKHCGDDIDISLSESESGESESGDEEEYSEEEEEETILHNQLPNKSKNTNSSDEEEEKEEEDYEALEKTNKRNSHSNNVLNGLSMYKESKMLGVEDTNFTYKRVEFSVSGVEY